ncbi:MAG: tRNA (adenosine(37)-N6)-dimethylallyltransferase MiaA [Spirochaetia bacterium]|nr:tRNA (adenosine(37)-N6)-dimethylallyltransferase MiaA [Spirochaetia bacterium]
MVEENSKIVYVLMGPTGSGKTYLTEFLNPDLFEVVSCDSRQVYREMPLGTAVPDEKTKKRIRHHLIECINPDQSLDASDYSRLAKEKIQEIFQKNKKPIIIGGTGFYYMSLKTEAFEAPANHEIRKYLLTLELEEKRKLLHKEDPGVLVNPGETTGAGRIHPNDDYRITRALEIILSTGVPWSEHWRKKTLAQNTGEYTYSGWYISVELESYKKRVFERAEQMIASGFLQEAERIAEKYGEDCPGLRSLGYKEALDAARGLISMDQFLEILGNLHYQYGRKQRTWFKREKELKGVTLEELTEIF